MQITCSLIQKQFPRCLFMWFKGQSIYPERINTICLILVHWPREIGHLTRCRTALYYNNPERSQPFYAQNLRQQVQGDDLPVNSTWFGAMEFCEKLNKMAKAPKGWKFTLPTETQWEYVAHGGDYSDEAEACRTERRDYRLPRRNAYGFPRCPCSNILLSLLGGGKI